ncbi:Alkaline phosphatase synthesis sensor protein phoR [uncultured Clostridium sp.]|uniref:PAS domain-containing sensor histidine kinase n=1 Tax=uncultured Clostridium sp. TaxID=59620 RepID=UPI000822384E|nr:PAS domain-containing sensor histidine kinase [uncultured Clostridium sp.]SCJ63748.1 Alkaline phosphatase synthesis sensor protein phoR [uncultured Clostridium sp.]
MESIFNCIDECMMVLDESNTIEFCNDSLLNRLNYKLDELVKKNLIIFVKDISNLDNDGELVIYGKEKNSIKFTYKINTADWKGNNAKILVLKEEEVYSKADLEKILENIQLLVWIRDLDGKYIFANKAYCNKFGLNKEEILGKRDRDIFCEEEAIIIEEEDRRLIEEKSSIRNEEKLRLNNKLTLFFVIKDIVLDKNENAKYVYGMAYDITDIRNLEEDRRKLEKEIEVEKVRNEFFNNISHEFKTPLNVLLSTTQLIGRYIKDKDIITISKDKIKNYIEIIENNSYRLLRLTDNLIDMTKIDTGEYKVILENKDIVSIVENVVLTACDYIGNINSDIIFDTNVEEEIIACDQEKIEKIILNLLSNAVKYGNDNGNIFVNIKSYENNIEISVKDNGIGISPDKINSIFDRFVQEDKSLSRKQEGSGLGLALVKSLVEMHEGSIRVKSKLGKGSEFTITLPRKKVVKNEQLKFNICNQTIFEKCMIEFSDIYAII